MNVDLNDGSRHRRDLRSLKAQICQGLMEMSRFAFQVYTLTEQCSCSYISELKRT